MAIVQCPHCNKKISDKAKLCPHCQVDMALEPDEQEQLAFEKRQKKLKSLNLQSMLSVVLVLLGFAMMYFLKSEQDSGLLTIANGTFALGCLWYLGNRVRYFLFKHMAK